MTFIQLAGNKIGPAWLSPMAGMGDRTFRRICHNCGADFVTTEMVSAKAVCFGSAKTELLARFDSEEGPTAIQLFGSEPDIMAKAAVLLLQDCALRHILPVAIDVNMGCPMPKIVKNGEGSALLQTPEKAAAIIDAMVRACSPVPVTAKLRLGWNKSNINVVDVAKRLEQSGVAALTIHARTRDEMYTPGIHPSYIREVKEAVQVPIVGNGDISTGADATEMLCLTGCDGVAVARGALGNPWIFREIHAALDRTPYTPPSKKEKLNMALIHFRGMLDEKGERVAVAESRAAIAYYTKGMTGATRIRGMMNVTERADDIIQILTEFAEETP